MALPKLNAPVFELILPSSGETIKYRPFLVKEEKILLIAQQSGEYRDIINSVVSIINNCVIDDIDAEKLPMFDIEYIFLNLRSKSVGNVAEISLKDPDDEKVYTVEVDLDKVEIVRGEELDSKIALSDEIGVIMKYPSMKDMMQFTNLNDTSNADNAFNIIMSSIEKVYDTDNVYEAADYTKEELEEFVMSLSSRQFQLIQEYFNNAPKISKKVDYVRDDGTIKEVLLEGLNDFF